MFSEFLNSRNLILFGISFLNPSLNESREVTDDVWFLTSEMASFHNRLKIQLLRTLDLKYIILHL